MTDKQFETIVELLTEIKNNTSITLTEAKTIEISQQQQQIIALLEKIADKFEDKG